MHFTHQLRIVYVRLASIEIRLTFPGITFFQIVSLLRTTSGCSTESIFLNRSVSVHINVQFQFAKITYISPNISVRHTWTSQQSDGLWHTKLLTVRLIIAHIYDFIQNSKSCSFNSLIGIFGRIWWRRATIWFKWKCGQLVARRHNHQVHIKSTMFHWTGNDIVLYESSCSKVPQSFKAFMWISWYLINWNSEMLILVCDLFYSAVFEFQPPNLKLNGE